MGKFIDFFTTKRSIVIMLIMSFLLAFISFFLAILFFESRFFAFGALFIVTGVILAISLELFGESSNWQDH